AAAGPLQVPFDHAAHPGDLVRVGQAFDRDHLGVHVGREGARLVEHVGDAAGHAGAEVPARGAQHHDAAAGHVFAAVIADGFDDRVDAAVAHAEALARHAADVGLAGRRAVEGDVADD